MMRKLLIVIAGLLFASSLLAQQLADPTRPLNKPAKSAMTAEGLNPDGFPVLTVSAVFINADSKHAILNGQTVVEGQKWRGFWLEKVHQSGIVLSNKQQKKEFLINNNNFIKDASHDF